MFAFLMTFGHMYQRGKAFTSLLLWIYTWRHRK